MGLEGMRGGDVPSRLVAMPGIPGRTVARAGAAPCVGVGAWVSATPAGFPGGRAADGSPGAVPFMADSVLATAAGATVGRACGGDDLGARVSCAGAEARLPPSMAGEAGRVGAALPAAGVGWAAGVAAASRGFAGGAALSATAGIAAGAGGATCFTAAPSAARSVADPDFAAAEETVRADAEVTLESEARAAVSRSFGPALRAAAFGAGLLRAGMDLATTGAAGLRAGEAAPAR
jgi:hypothetical protein